MVAVTAFTICGKSHPHQQGVVCTKPEGHDGRHGRRNLPQRSVLWQYHLAVAAARDE